MEKFYYFFLKAAFFGLAALIIIPKEQYKKFFLYGLFFGAVADTLFIFLFSGLLHAFNYSDLGPFGLFGLFSFWSPLAWMFAFMFFLYLLPRRKWFLYAYVVVFAIFGEFVGLVLQNLGVFHFHGVFIFLAPLVFLTWFGGAAWFYIRNEKIELIS